MKRPLVAFAAGCLAFALAAGGSAYALVGGDGIRNCGIAAGLCIIPSFMTLLVAELWPDKDPAVQAMVVMGGGVVRMGAVLAGAAVLVRHFPQLVAGGDLAFWGWVILFYLFTLAWEVTLLASRPATPRPPSPPPAGGPAV